jgi:hypothetical protein
MTTAPKTGDVNDFFSRFRRKLCLTHGYDENLNYIGGARSELEATGTKAFLEPRDSLTYAIEDSRTLDEPKSLVNCLTNCKRAIDAQIDRMIHRLGFLPLARKQRWPIPRKLSFISDSGSLAPKDSQKPE